MYKKKCLLLIGAFIFICKVACAINIDSLRLTYENEQSNAKDRISAALSIAKTHKYTSSAKPYYLNALKWSIEIDDRKSSAVSLWKLGIVYYNKAIYDSSAVYYSKALEHYDALGMTKEQSTLLQNIGKIDSKQGRWPEAIVKYQKALKLSENIQDTGGVATIYNLIGSIHRKQKNYDDALKYLTNALQTAQSIDLISTQIDALGNIATTYQEIDSITLAAEYFKQTLDLSRSHGYERREAVCLMTLGQIHQMNGQVDKAKYYLESANELYIKLGNIRGTAPIKAALGQIEAMNGNGEKAVYYCEEAYEMALSSGNVTAQKSVLSCLIKAYEAAGDYKMANEYFKKLDDLKTEFYKESKIQEVTELQMEFAFEKEKELAALEQKQKDVKQMWVQNGLLLGLLLLGLLAFQFYRASVERKRNNRILSEKNDIITKALEEKKLLLREIHHRVKNNLQVVSSLLSMQSRFIEDENAQEAIKEGRDRVRSMALIHQNLYQDDNLTGIEVQTYFNKLIRSLFNSYNISSNRIHLNLEVDPLNLDVDTVVPLGLIVNELVSNALKYAFPNDREGTIQIQLSEVDHDTLKLVVADDGVGMSGSIPDELSDSFGYRMIHAFKDKLEGTLEIHQEKGTVVEMKILDYQKAG